MAALSKESSQTFFGSLIPNTPKKVMVIAALLVLIGLLKMKLQSGGHSSSGGSAAKGKGKKDDRGKGNIDSIFFQRLSVLLRIVIPRWNCIEIREIALLNIFLVVRTMLSIYIASINGKIVNAIVKLDFPLFVKRILSLGICSIPASFVNSYLDYLIKSIALNFRKRLTFYFHESYIKDMIFYQISNLDVRVANPDQRLTVDIEKWAFSLSSLYSNLSKPLLDIVLFSRRLANNIGWEGPGLVFALYIINIFILRAVTPPFGKLTAIDQLLEGEYRGCHTDLIHHAEEIAFCRGDGWEKKRINTSFEKLMDHQNLVTNKRLFMGCFDALLSKYGAVLNGFWIVGLPVFGPGKEEYLKKIKNDKTKITRDIIQNLSLLINLSKAIGRLVVSYKEMQHLAGYTTVVSEMHDVIEDLKKGKFQKSISAERQEKTNNEVLTRGEVFVSDFIKFEDVPLYTPNNDALADKLSFEIHPGMSCIITGPNGCGKSSLFRILSSLWPSFGGKIFRPSADKIFYVPQRAYLPNGTLRDQVIYPHNLREMKEKRISDTDIFKLLEAVNLAYLVQREGGFDSVNDWYDVLSGGEKQRIVLARLFYHKPQFAILDDCTSAVSMDVEDKLYSQCKERGITIFTVSHRKTLFKYHDYRLQFDGEGHWTFEKLLHETTPQA